MPVPKATPKTARRCLPDEDVGGCLLPKATPKTPKRCLPDEDVGGCPRSAACLPRKLGRGQWLGVTGSGLIGRGLFGRALGVSGA